MANVSSLQVAEVIVDAGRIVRIGFWAYCSGETEIRDFTVAEWGVKPTKLRGKLKVDLKSDR